MHSRSRTLPYIFSEESMPIRALPPEREQEQTRIQARSREKTDENQGIAGTLKTLARKSIGNIYSGLQQLASAPPRKPPVSQLARPISPLPHTPFRASRDLEPDFNTAFVERSRAQTPTHAKRKHPPCRRKLTTLQVTFQTWSKFRTRNLFRRIHSNIYTPMRMRSTGRQLRQNLARDAPSTPRMEKNTYTRERTNARQQTHGILE